MGTATGLEAVVCESFGCSPEVAALLSGHARVRRYAQRSTIIAQGQALTEAHLLIEGEAHEVYLAVNGQEVLLQILAPGAFFGEYGLVADAEAAAEVMAAQSCSGAAFAASDFVILMQVHGCIGLAVSRAMIARAAAMAQRLVAVSILSATGRVCAELARRGRSSGDGVVRPVPVWTELAREVQTTRETVSRTVADLKRRGIVRQDGDALVIVAPRMLDDLVV